MRVNIKPVVFKLGLPLKNSNINGRPSIARRGQFALRLWCLVPKGNFRKGVRTPPPHRKIFDKFETFNLKTFRMFWIFFSILFIQHFLRFFFQNYVSHNSAITKAKRQRPAVFWPTAVLCPLKKTADFGNSS